MDQTKNIKKNIKNGKLFVANFSDFYLALSASVNDANPKTEFIYHTHDPRYGLKYAASSKNGKLFVADFSDFYDIHKSLDEFEIRPDPTTDHTVSCP